MGTLGPCSCTARTGMFVCVQYTYTHTLVLLSLFWRCHFGDGGRVNKKKKKGGMQQCLGGRGIELRQSPATSSLTSASWSSVCLVCLFIVERRRKEQQVGEGILLTFRLTLDTTSPRVLFSLLLLIFSCCIPPPPNTLSTSFLLQHNV